MSLIDRNLIDHRQLPKDLPDRRKDTDLESSAHTESVCDRTERLRRFLSVCLAIDYRFTSQSPDQLRKDEFRHFVSLAQRCFLDHQELNNLDYINWLAPRDINILDPVIDMHILEPAEALKIPSSVAISMLRMFIPSIYFWINGYESQICWLASRTSLKNVAAELFMDRNLLFGAVIPPSSLEFRTFIDACWQRKRSWYFDDLRGPTDFDVGTAHGGNQRRKLEVFIEARPALRNLESKRFAARTRWECESAATVAEYAMPPVKGDSWRIKLMRWWIKPRCSKLFVDIDGDGGMYRDV